MMTNKLVSVIVPAYQHGHFLKRCLDSIFHQTYRPLEIIVIDDGSTDETNQLIRPYLSRLSYVYQSNRGASAARNRGAALAAGDFLLFCDADVELRPFMIERLIGALADLPEADFAYSSFRFGWKRFRSWPFDHKLLRQLNYIHTTSLIRRQAFPGFDEKLRRFQDWDVWLKIVERGGKGIYVPEELFRVRTSGRRAAISQWRPSFFIRFPWPFFGWTPPAVKKYLAAREILWRKHGLDQ